MPQERNRLRTVVGAGNRVEQHTGVLEGKIPVPPSLQIAAEYGTSG